MSVHKEIWTGEVLKKFRAMPTFMDAIASRDELVGNKVIHLTDLGVDPKVLIDNTVYPIATNESEDSDVTIVMRKLETENTAVTDDELYAISYDKIAEKTDQHGEALNESAGKLALHSLAPQSNTADTPVIEATGADDGTGRKMLLPKDITALKLAYDKMKIPQSNRHLVLSPEHVNDLLNADEKFANQFQNRTTGKILPYHGFQIHEFAEPVYYGSDNTKKSFGSEVTATDRVASVAFYAPRCLKAQGMDASDPEKVKMYYRLAENDPEHRQTVIGFRTYFICIPKKAQGTGAIVSPQA